MSPETIEKPKKKAVVRMPEDAEPESPAIVVGVGHAKPEPLHTDDVPPVNRDPFEFPLNDPFVHPTQEIVKAPEVLAKEYADLLAFAQEPIEINIAQSTEKYGALTAPCWNNGIGIELYDRQVGRWYSVDEAPRGLNIITRRKYAEQLIKSMTEMITTEVIEQPGADPHNWLRPKLVRNYPIQIIRDDSPKAKEWFLKTTGQRVG